MEFLGPKERQPKLFENLGSEILSGFTLLGDIVKASKTIFKVNKSKQKDGQTGKTENLHIY